MTTFACLVAQVDRMFQETSSTWGLAVGILITILVAGFLGVTVIIRWMRPLAEKVITSHLQTLETFRATSIAMTDSQVRIQAKLEQIIETDMELKKTLGRHSDVVRMNTAKLEDNTKELKGNTDAVKGACKYASHATPKGA